MRGQSQSGGLHGTSQSARHQARRPMSGGDGALDTGGWQFAGRTVLVTGAASGIGRALALGLAAAGARLALADLQPDALGETAAAVSARGAACLARPVDVSNEDQVGAF